MIFMIIMIHMIFNVKSMFSKLKQLKDLRTRAKDLQNALSDETTTVEKNNIRIVMDGNMNITSIDIETDMSREEIAKTIADLVNDAIKKTQRNMAMKVQQMGGLPGM